MGKKTGIIKFNVKDRGRRFRGVDRNFDTDALSRMLNSGEVQERVKHGDLCGYYGHWLREEFGMNPGEGTIVGGKQVSFEPAVRTTYLKGYPNGDIEHEIEFLDTNPGRLAARLYDSKMGGLSSAIDITRVGDKQLPVGFFGFDYVLEPNFTQNRGYEVALDSAESAEAIFDKVAEYNSMISACNEQFDNQEQKIVAMKEENDRLVGLYDSAIKTVHKLSIDNEELSLMLMRAEKNKEVAVLDGVTDIVHQQKTNILDNADDFLNMDLQKYEPVLEKATEEEQAVERFNQRRWG